MTTTFTLNGTPHTADTPPGRTLLVYLRSIGLAGAKHGCETGECGACTVLLDDRTVNSCMVLVATLEGRRVETIESLGAHGDLHPLQEAFLDEGAAQCGYCTPAMILALEALRRRNPAPDENEVRDALSGVLCRCTGYVKPVKAGLRLPDLAAGGAR